MKLAAIAIVLGLAMTLASPAHATRYQECHKVLQHHQWMENCTP